MRVCGKCKVPKADEEFGWRKIGVRRQSYCKDCQKAYRKAHYEDNKDKYRAKAREWDSGRRKRFYEWLSTQKCVDCGNDDFRVLEFDHVSGEKEGNISKMLANVSEERLAAEVDKCEVVCANCHRIRTAERGNFYEYL